MTYPELSADEMLEKKIAAKNLSGLLHSVHCHLTTPFSAERAIVEASLPNSTMQRNTVLDALEVIGFKDAANVQERALSMEVFTSNGQDLYPVARILDADAKIITFSPAGVRKLYEAGVTDTHGIIDDLGKAQNLKRPAWLVTEHTRSR
jgi:hypothetical protein